MSTEKKCEHEWARIWLASRNYKETKYCRKCLELWNAATGKKARQESTQT
jgi:hypothetical protein